MVATARPHLPQQPWNAGTPRPAVTAPNVQTGPVIPPGYRPIPEPTPPPQDREAANRIYKLAQFAVKNGVAFENMMKAREAENPNVRFPLNFEWILIGRFPLRPPCVHWTTIFVCLTFILLFWQFGFLFGGLNHSYYIWTRHCIAQQFSTEKITELVNQYKQALQTMPKFFALTTPDQRQLENILLSLNGTKVRLF